MKSRVRREISPGLLGMVMATAMALLFIAAPLSAEYAFFGEASIGLDVVEASGNGSLLFGSLRVDGDHAFYRQWGEARLRHALVVRDGGSGSHDLYQASFSWYPSDSLTFVFGRHQIGWGMGWAFFPSDALHPQRLAAGQSGVVRGFDGASVVKVFSPHFSAAFALRGDEAFGDSGDGGGDGDGGGSWWENLRYAALLQGYGAGLDMSVSAVWKPEGVFRPGAGVSMQLFGSVLTADASVDLLHAGRPYPGAALYLPDWEARPAVAVGIERSLTGDSGSLTLVAEYLWDSRGYSSKEREALFADTGAFLENYYAAAAAAGKAPSPGRHYLYPMISGSWEDRFGLDNYALISLSDASVFAGHRLWWNIGDGFELGATGSWIFEPSSTSEAALAGIMAAESADAGKWQVGLEAKFYF